MNTNKIIQGDAIEEMKKLPEKSVNMLMTSPPYWALRDYGSTVETIWDGKEDCEHEWEEHIQQQRGGRPKKESSVGRWKQAMTMGFGMEGKKIKTNFCNKCSAWKGQLGLEPTFDLYIKHLCDIFDEVKRVLRGDGTCWVNIGDTYSNSNWLGDKPGKWNKQPIAPATMGRGAQPNYLDKCLTLIPSRFAIEMVNRGWILRNVIIWHKRNCMPSSVKDRFTVDFEYLFFFSKKKKYYFETQYEPFISIPTKKRDKRNEGYGKAFLTPLGKGLRSGYEQGRKNKRTVWTINLKPFKEAHFAVYPERLCETPIKAGCPKDGIVLDPFFGAGTTGLVALKQNKKFIGIELNKEYIEIAKKRLKPYLEQTKL